MNWPPASDYQDAIQNPGTCFHDPELKGGQPALNRLGLPRVASGNFASVYQVHGAVEKWAVRCFLRQGADQNRYALLSGYLSTVSIPGLVGFAYLSQGIRVRGQWLPAVKMDWVDGVTLQSYVAKHLQEGAKLRSLALEWQTLLADLRRSRVAHCDLQHGNVLVGPDEHLRLVDYDGMYVPPLKGQPSHELGHPNYQHPGRTEADYNEDLDNFSALVIYTALRALVAEPGLWTSFDTGENLLFSAPDFKAPAQSPLFRRLRMSPDTAVSTLADRIAKACAGTPAGVPDFQRVVGGLPPICEPEPWWHGAVQAAGRSEAASPQPSRGPRVPPLPAPGSSDRNRAGEQDPDDGHNWWTKRPSTIISELRAPNWLAPAAVGEAIMSRARAMPVRQTVRRGSGCLAAAGASCVVGVMLTIGAGIALQFAFQQIGSWLSPPPPAPPPSARSSVTRPAAPRSWRP